MKKLLLAAVIIVFHISISFAPAAARDIYVSTNGSSSGTGSIESPLDKLSRALGQANPGDTIIMRGGTYSESEIWYTGSGGEKGAYLTITGYPGEESIQAGSRLIIESKYVRIQNLYFLGEQLIVRRWEGHGYQMSHHIEILNNHFSLDRVAIYFNCNDGLIQHNIFESAQYAIYLMHGDGNVIRGNRLYNTPSYGIHIYDENKYQYAGENDPRITNLLVENNIIIGSKTRSGIIVSAGESSSLGIHIDGVTILNNVIANNKAAGIAVLYYGSVRNLEICNNTIYNNSNGGIKVNPLEDADNITIINNILSNNQSNHISISGVSNKTVKNNLYWLPETVGSGVTDTDAVFGDPLFENASQNNFHLLEGSQAIDAGEDIGIKNDLEGNPRPQGFGYDLGAYEYIQTSSPPPPSTPPDAPTGVSPEDETNFYETGTITLKASAFSDPDGDDHSKTHWQVRRADNDALVYEEISTTDLTEHTIATSLTPGLKYAWEVGYEDANGNVSWSEECTFKVGVSEAESLPQIYAGTDIADFDMISFAHWPDDPRATSVISIIYDSKNYKIGTYDPTIGGYIEYGSSLMIKPGRAYWVLAREGLTIDYEGVPVSLSTYIDVSLSYNASTGNGWNMVACPNAANYLWADVEVVEYDADGNVVFGPKAISTLPDPNDYIDLRLWQWVSGSYDDGTTLMAKYKGYWVKAKRANVYLRFPVSAQASFANSKTMFAALLNRSARWLDKWILSPKTATADSGDSPPMPMGALSNNTNGDGGGGGSCFIATAAYGWRSHGTACQHMP